MTSEEKMPTVKDVLKPKGIIPCKFPDCDCKKGAEQTFPVQLVDELDAAAQLPFCLYHWYIVCGNGFKCKMTKADNPNDDTFELIGPFKEVSLIEQVIGAVKIVEKSRQNEKT